MNYTLAGRQLYARAKQISSWVRYSVTSLTLLTFIAVWYQFVCYPLMAAISRYNETSSQALSKKVKFDRVLNIADARECDQLEKMCDEKMKLLSMNEYAVLEKVCLVLKKAAVTLEACMLVERKNYVSLGMIQYDCICSGTYENIIQALQALEQCSEVVCQKGLLEKQEQGCMGKVRLLLLTRCEEATKREKQ